MFLQQIDRFRQTQETALFTDELQAKTVDRAEERAAQIGQEGLAALRAFVELLQDEVAGADAQFFGGEFAVRHDDEPGEDVPLAVVLRGEVGDAARDGRGLAHARARRDAEIFVQRVDESFARVGVEQRGGGGRHGTRRHRRG